MMAQRLAERIHRTRGRYGTREVYVVCLCGCLCHPEFRVTGLADAMRRESEFGQCPKGWPLK